MSKFPAMTALSASILLCFVVADCAFAQQQNGMSGNRAKKMGAAAQSARAGRVPPAQVGDVDGDGKPDVVVGPDHPDHEAHAPVGDVDNDGKPDVVIGGNQPSDPPPDQDDDTDDSSEN